MTDNLTDGLIKAIKDGMEEDNQAWGLGLVKYYEQENKELKALIEKMKCCGNCKYNQECEHLCENLEEWELDE